jgi:hypothetical protein
MPSNSDTVFDDVLDDIMEDERAATARQFADFVHMREVWWCTLGVNLG